ncbi:glucose 1-dehydrogenase [Paraburkholderia sp. Ac-20336]|uniref:SDR family NAD(P)-dependent oxidoreductase n=1 Tax=unclassified Paraburkholderia TaxID=2615204 RepID=UPI0014237CB6|nr:MULTISPECIES: glucose 1-dehydrogenase [unclassified Paraburkholderia]MBN3801674.1 glucose 1-dehydrogenase [Paraburkholderia sp. Ac-20336]NIF75947.1 glucose 1-dehydrogenase [Paraburkholderia sp. Cy-641]
MKLADKVAIVTGAASGIGADAARTFAREGAKVALVDLNGDALASVEREITEAGGEALAICANVADAEAVQAGVARVLSCWQHVDVLLTCSAISPGGRVDELDEATWDRVFDINVKGCFLWARAVLPTMLARQRGSIVFVGSQLVASSGGGNASYVASKGAVATLAKTMAVDYASQGIRVNALMPGVIDTPMSRTSIGRSADPDATRTRWQNRHAMKRFGRVEETSRAALFLASDDSSFTTGSWLFVDGGWSAT